MKGFTSGPKVPAEALLGFYATSFPKLSHWERHTVVWSEESKADVTWQLQSPLWRAGVPQVGYVTCKD